MDETPKDRVKRLMREAGASNVTHISEAAKRRGRTHSSAAAPSIHGNNNVVGNHNQVTINVRPASRPKLEIKLQPGPAHISDLQAFELQQLVNKIVQVSGKSYAQVWGAFRNRFVVPSYRLLPVEQHEAACHYLRAWVASAEAKSGAAKPPDRKRMLARIHAEGKKRPQLIERARDFMEHEFGTRMLRELTDDQLAKVIKQCGL